MVEVITGPPGAPGAKSVCAYPPIIPGRWCAIHAYTYQGTYAWAPGATSTFLVPLWTGSGTRLRGIWLPLSGIADTAGNVVKFALYQDSGELWPRELVAELGEVSTTTTVIDEAKTLDCDQPVTAQSTYWLAWGNIGGGAAGGGANPTFKIVQGGNPLLAFASMGGGTASSPPNHFLRQTAPFPDPVATAPSNFVWGQVTPMFMYLMGT